MQYENKLPWARWSAAGLIWASTAAAAQTWGSGQRDPGPMPTRLALCQYEVAPSAAADRGAQLRVCLARRLEGERVVERECKRQTAAVASGAPRRQALRHCERLALDVPSAQLPRSPAPLLPRRPAGSSPAAP